MPDTSDAVRVPQCIDVGGRRLRHLVLGEGGEAVVMVHGFGGSVESWSANQAILAARGRRVAALDLPGHGESSVDVGSGSLVELASTLVGYMDAVGIGRADLVGHSMGAAVCLVLADRDPARVRSVTLVGPAGLGQKLDGNFIRGLIAAQRREDLAPLLAVLFADPARVTDELLDRVVAWKQRPGVTAALTRIASSRYTGTPSGRSLREVAGSVPTLVIWGADDRMIPPPAPAEIARDGVSYDVLPRCGHMVQLESADDFNRRLAQFLGA